MEKRINIWYHICGIQKIIQINLYIKHKQTPDIENRFLVFKGKNKGGSDKLMTQDWKIETTIYKIGNNDLLCSKVNSTHFHGIVNL